MRTTAQLVRSWYETHRNNDEHPFTIPQRSLVALVAAVQTEIDRIEAEREAEQLAAPTHEEEG